MVFRRSVVTMFCKPVYLRVGIKVTISIIYYFVISAYAPLGLKWVNWHQMLVRSAAENLFDNPWLFHLGLTQGHLDFNQIDHYSRYPANYIVPSFQYVFHLSVINLLGADLWQKLVPIYHYCIVCSIALMLSNLIEHELSSLAFYSKIKRRISGTLLDDAIDVAVFSVFLFSTWTYRAIIAPWQELHFLFFFCAAMVLWKKQASARFSPRRTGSLGTILPFILYFLAVLNQYQWGFFLGIFYSISLVFGVPSPKKMLYFPPSLSSYYQRLWHIFVSFSPTFLLLLQLYLLGKTHLGSSPMQRIGLDTSASIHYGGFLSVFQFMGGNRVTLCVANFNPSLISSKIYAFNCILSVASIFLLSCISLVTIMLLIRSGHLPLSWFFLPVFFSFFFMAGVFQQSFSVHLMGYTIVYSIIFALGIVVAIFKFLSLFSDEPPIFFCFYFLALLFVSLSFVKNIYLTPVGG